MTGVTTRDKAGKYRCPKPSQKDGIGGTETEIRGRAYYEWNFELNGHRMDETRSSDLYTATTLWTGDGPVHVSNSKKVLLFPPESTPLLLDYEDFHPRAPKPAKNVVYMDGHTTGLELAPVILKQAQLNQTSGA